MAKETNGKAGALKNIFSLEDAYKKAQAKADAEKAKVSEAVLAFMSEYGTVDNDGKLTYAGRLRVNGVDMQPVCRVNQDGSRTGFLKRFGDTEAEEIQF